MNKKYIYAGALLIILLLSLWIRLAPMNLQESCLDGVTCFRALDPFYMYRMSLHLIENDFHWPDKDMYQYYPNGRDPHTNKVLTYYIPAILYVLFFKFFFTYYHFAWIYPALMGTLQVLVVYFLGKELKDKKTGLFAAFFYATTPAILYRTSAGFIEKEPIAGVFILLILYYTIKSFKKDTIFYSSLAGMSLCFLNAISGLVTPIALLIIGLYFILLLFEKQNISLLLKSLVPMGIVGIIFPFLLGFKNISITPIVPGGQMYIGLSILMAFVYVMQNKIKDKSLHKYIVPLSIISVVFMIIIGSFFSVQCSRLVTTVSGLATLEKGVVGSTVAENAPGSVGTIKEQFSIVSGLSYLQQAINTPLFNPDSSYNNYGKLLSYFSVIPFTLLAIFFIFYQFYEKRESYKNKDVFYIGLIVVPLLGYFNLYYGLIALVLFVSYYSANIGIILLILWMASSIHGSLKYIRVMFLLGAPLCIMAGFGISYLYDYVKKLIENKSTIDFFNKYKKHSSANIEILPVKIIAVLFCIIFIATNLSSAYVVNKYTGLTFNANWQEAMKWVKDNTPQEAVLMSWWDYGYWFQTAGERRSVADGMNANNTVNENLAQMFTDTNITHIKNLMISYQADYIIVDNTLIGKYPMMSRIGHYAQKNEYYEEDNLFGKPENYFAPLPEPKLEKKGNLTIAMYDFGGGIISVPVNEYGGLEGNIILTQGLQNLDIKYLCTENGLIDLTENKTQNVADLCILFSKYGVYMPYPTKTPGISNFARLYLFDAHGIDFLEKVFDNNEIKIFRLKKESEIVKPIELEEIIIPETIPDENNTEKIKIDENQTDEPIVNETD